MEQVKQMTFNDSAEILNALKILSDKLDKYQNSNDEKLFSLRKDIDVLFQSRNPHTSTTPEAPEVVSTMKQSSTEIIKPRLLYWNLLVRHILMNFLDRKTAYVFEESYMWHNPGGVIQLQQFMSMFIVVQMYLYVQYMYAYTWK